MVLNVLYFPTVPDSPDSMFGQEIRRMSLGYHNLSCDQRLGTSGPKVTLFLCFTTVPSLKTINLSDLRLYVVLTQRHRALKGKTILL